MSRRDVESQRETVEWMPPLQRQDFTGFRKMMCKRSMRIVSVGGDRSFLGNVGGGGGDGRAEPMLVTIDSATVTTMTMTAAVTVKAVAISIMNTILEAAMTTVATMIIR
jgi:hypothetical protein